MIVKIVTAKITQKIDKLEKVLIKREIKTHL